MGSEMCIRDRPEFLRISLLSGPEIKLKSLMARRKKLVRPIKAQTSRTDVGVGQFLITRVFASPGLIPFSLQISYPRYVIVPAPMLHLLGFIFRLCLRNRAKTWLSFSRFSSCEETEMTTSSI